MRAQCILRHKLFCYLASETNLDPAGDIDLSQFLLLEFRVVRELLSLTCEISMFGVRLRADRDIFSRRHGHSASNQTGQTRKQDIALGSRS